MKKTLFILLLSILFAGTSFAQVKVGVTVGLNSSSFSETGDEAEEYNYLIGLQAGLVVDFKITEIVSVIPELLFSQRGAYQLFEQVGNAKNTQKNYCILNYLQLPLNLAANFKVGQSSKFTVFAGPYAGYLLNAQQKIETEIDGEKTTETEDIKIGSGKEEMKALDYGINIGAGYQFGNGMFIKVQYNLGLNNLYNYDSRTLKNRNLAITIGYYF